MNTSDTPRPLPVRLSYGRDGRLLDPYRLLDSTSERARANRYWVQQQLDVAASDRQVRADIFAMEAELDPDDHSPQAEHLREVAGSEHDHADAEARRTEWAAAALQADPGLAGRMHPVVAEDARALIEDARIHGEIVSMAGEAAASVRTRQAAAGQASQAEAEAQLWAGRDRDLAVAARLEGPGIDDLALHDQDAADEADAGDEDGGAGW